MLDDDIIGVLGSDTFYNVPVMGQLLYNIYIKKLVEKYHLLVNEDFLDFASSSKLLFLNGSNDVELPLDIFSEYEYLCMELLTSLEQRCNLKIYFSDYFDCLEENELEETKKEILNTFPTLTENIVNENFVGHLSDIDYTCGIIINDCDYELKKELFLSNHTQSEFDEYEEYFEYPFNAFWYGKRILINGEEFIFVTLGTCGSSSVGYNDLNMNFVQSKIEFQQALE